MTSCTLLSSEIEDAALGATPSSALAAHLVTCAACAAQLERRRALAQRIGRAVEEYVRAEPPAGLPERIRARASMEQPHRWRKRWLIAPAGAALAAGFLMFVYVLAGTRAPVHTTDIAALAAWRSPTASLLSSSSNVLGTPFTLRGFHVASGRSRS
jgi:anti-sigma factor RsiW